ncbi:MAG: nucleotidyltransferase family protein [Thermoleophilia bacterium]
MTAVLDSKLDLIVSACARHNVSRLDVFGSVLRDDFRLGESDVDILVEFKPLSGYERVDAYF